MRTRASQAATLVSTHSDFDIGRPALLDQTDVDQIITAGEIVEDMRTLKSIGLDVMPAVATEIVNSGVELEAANGSEPWQRKGGIGSGTLGPWSPVWDLVHAIQASQSEVGAELVAAGEALAIAADMMTQSEEQVEERLRQHAGTVSGVGTP